MLFFLTRGRVMPVTAVRGWTRLLPAARGRPLQPTAFATFSTDRYEQAGSIAQAVRHSRSELPLAALFPLGVRLHGKLSRVLALSHATRGVTNAPAA
jgi:hypothetical protein